MNACSPSVSVLPCIGNTGGIQQQPVVTSPTQSMVEDALQVTSASSSVSMSVLNDGYFIFSRPPSPPSQSAFHLPTPVMIMSPATSLSPPQPYLSPSSYFRAPQLGHGRVHSGSVQMGGRVSTGLSPPFAQSPNDGTIGHQSAGIGAPSRRRSFSLSNNLFSLPSLGLSPTLRLFSRQNSSNSPTGASTTTANNHNNSSAPLIGSGSILRNFLLLDNNNGVGNSNSLFAMNSDGSSQIKISKPDSAMIMDDVSLSLSAPVSRATSIGAAGIAIGAALVIPSNPCSKSMSRNSSTGSDWAKNNMDMDTSNIPKSVFPPITSQSREATAAACNINLSPQESRGGSIDMNNNNVMMSDVDCKHSSTSVPILSQLLSQPASSLHTVHLQQQIDWLFQLQQAQMNGATGSNQPTQVSTTRIPTLPVAQFHPPSSIPSEQPSSKLRQGKEGNPASAASTTTVPLAPPPPSVPPPLRTSQRAAAAAAAAIARKQAIESQTQKAESNTASDQKSNDGDDEDMDDAACTDGSDGDEEDSSDEAYSDDDEDEEEEEDDNDDEDYEEESVSTRTRQRSSNARKATAVTSSSSSSTSTSSNKKRTSTSSSSSSSFSSTTSSSIPSPASTSRRRQKANPSESFVCDKCSKSFTQKGGLMNHLRIHANERPFVCPVPGCERAFAQKCNLTRHARCHTGEKPFKCECCDRAFNRRWGLMVHAKCHPGYIPSSEPIKKKGKKPSQKHTFTINADSVAASAQLASSSQ